MRSIGAGPRRAAHPAITSNELVVTFGHTALGAPPVGSAMLASLGSARVFGEAIRSHLVGVVPPGALAGVSPAILTAKVRVANATERDAVAGRLRRDPAVLSVAPNAIIWLDDSPFYRSPVAAAGVGATPNNPLYAFQSWHYGLVDLPRAWVISTGSAAVVVAVVDDGIRFDHPALTANLTHDGYDFVNNVDSLPLCAGGKISNSGKGGYNPDPTNPGAYSPDSTGKCFLPDAIGNHGLHVAGTIGAVGNDGIGVTGVNWTVRIRPVRVLGQGGFGTSYDVAQGVLYAAGLPADNGTGSTVKAPSGARIINMSLGSATDDTTLHRAITSAAQAGALIVVAAGNAATSLPFYPAAYPEVLAVAAVGADGQPAPYSNYGPYVAIRAPGGNFALGDATFGVMSSLWNFATSSPEYGWAEGTSMATPHVSGVAALILSTMPSLSAAELRSRLTSYATGKVTVYGAGLVNAYNSLTARHGPPTQLYARAYGATTGLVGPTVAADANGRFQFSKLEAATYYVYAGTDESGDGGIGIPGRLWGAYGGVTSPGLVTLLGPSSNSVALSITYPEAGLANHAIVNAVPLMIGGYMQGRIVDAKTIDTYRVRIPAAATYTFETQGWVAACGIAMEDATTIGLFDAKGTLLTFTGYIDTARLNYCSRLTLNLNPGTYYVGVAGFGYRYRLAARAGP